MTIVGDTQHDGLHLLALKGCVVESAPIPFTNKATCFDSVNLPESQCDKISSPKMPAGKTPHPSRPPKVGDAKSPISVADSDSSGGGDMSFLCSGPDCLAELKARCNAKLREVKTGRVLPFENDKDWVSPLATVVKKHPAAIKKEKVTPKEPDVIDLMSSPESPESPSECADGLGMSQFAAVPPAQKPHVKAGAKPPPKRPKAPKPANEDSKPPASRRPTRTRKPTNCCKWLAVNFSCGNSVGRLRVIMVTACSMEKKLINGKKIDSMEVSQTKTFSVVGMSHGTSKDTEQQRLICHCRMS